MDMWPAVDRLIERAESATLLYQHRLHLYAAWRWRESGREVSAELRDLERSAALTRMGLSAVAARMRDAYDGPVVLLKGADVASLYPRPDLRPSEDIDVLVPDAGAVYHTLKAAGFVEDETALPDGHHHLQPLQWPGLPGCIEIHSTPNWPTWMSPPPPAELLEAAETPSQLGHGILALSATHRALVLLAHLWRDDPMRRLGQLADVLLAQAHADGRDVAETAAGWGLARALRSTNRAADDLLTGRDGRWTRSRPLTRPLAEMRERSMLEARLTEAVAPFYGLPAPRAVAAACGTVAGWIRPRAGESWSRKIRRTGRLRGTLSTPVSTVDRQRSLDQGTSHDRAS